MKTNKPTSGPWVAIMARTAIYIGPNNGRRVAVVSMHGGVPAMEKTEYLKQAVEDAKLIASAGTSATSCEALGYDGTKCVENLGGMLNLFIRANKDELGDNWRANVKQFLSPLKNPQG